MKITLKTLCVASAALLVQVGWAEQKPPSGQNSPPQRVEELSRAPDLQLEEAARAVERMKADPLAQDMLRRAKGVFILPKYDRKAMTVNSPPARGILLVRSGEKWSHPIFYNLGPVQLGAHAGAGLSSLAALLISESAVDKFLGAGRFSLSSDDGFNMTDHGRQAGLFPDEGDDVVMWSDAAGIFPGAAVRIDAIRTDDRANSHYFGRTASPEELSRADAKEHPVAEKLQKALGY